MLQQYLDALSPLSPATWKKVAPLFREMKLEKGDYLIREGEQVNELYFLSGGIARAFYRSADGTEYNKHFFTAPCFMGGYASLITGKPNQINQQALSDCQLLAADYQAFSALYDSCRDLERAARRLAELFFVNKEQREIDIVMLDADKRYLLFRKEYPALEQQIPQYHIASYLGITPTQLSRIRRKFAAK